LHKEINFIAELLEEGVRNNEFQENASLEIANALLTVATSVRYREVHISIVNMAAEADYQKIVSEVGFISSLILTGIKK